MNDHSLNDPHLQSFEARLAAAAPHASPDVQQRLLYECGIAAGQKAGRRRLRCWQAAAAVLVVLLLSLGVIRARAPGDVVHHQPQRPVPNGAAPLQIGADDIVASTERSPLPELDAWQVPPDNGAALADEVTRFKRLDPHLRSFAVVRLSRKDFEP